MSTTLLKIIALVFMLIDHIGAFIPNTPIYFRWIGRLSAPIFFFCTVWGFHYTKNRKGYIKRLYGMSVVMSILVFTLNNVFFSKSTSPITNNIFATLLLVTMIIWILDTIREDRQKGIKLFLAFIAFQIFGIVFVPLISDLFLNSFILPELFTGNLFANILYAEGAPLFVLYGVLLGTFKENKLYLAMANIVFVLSFIPIDFVLSNGNFQWLMIFSVPFMLIYNNKKGKGYKNLFYIFYPVHIVILFLVGIYIS